MFNHMSSKFSNENKPLGAKNPLLVGEEVRKDDVGNVGS
jgi:hypothetical protein